MSETTASKHSILHSLLHLEGNSRGIVYTEALWGIPYTLFAPYVSIYMLSLGLSDSQIGLVISIGLVLQIVTALFGGVLTDKFGRKLTTFVFDVIAWTIPCVIWAVAQDFNYFVLAAVFNAFWRIPMTAWSCLLVEDTKPEMLMDVYTWIYIAQLVSALFAPLAGVLINQFSLVPTVRGLYVFAAVMMTLKFVVMNAYVDETKQGKVRMAETKGKSLLLLLGEYRAVLPRLLHSRATLFTMGLLLVLGIVQMINNSFWSIFVTEKLHIPAQHIAIYPMARSILMVLFYFMVTPLIREMNFKRPLITGFGVFIVSQLVLITMPERNYLLLLVSVLLEAMSFATVSLQIDRMLALTVEPEERARIVALIYVIVISLTSPFGWIAGTLSEVDRTLPFMLNISLFLIGALLAYLAGRPAVGAPRPLEA